MLLRFHTSRCLSVLVGVWGKTWFRSVSVSWPAVHQNQLRTSSDNAHARRSPLNETTWMVRQCALLMWKGRKRERADKTDPQCSLIISSRAWRHCCRYCCYSFTLASLLWLVDLTDAMGQTDSMSWGKLALLLLITSELSIRRLDRGRETDRDIEGDQTTRAHARSRWSIIMTCSDRRSTID